MGNDNSYMKSHAKRNVRLLEASSRGRVESIYMLLGDGASINCQDKHGETSLMWAVKNRHVEVVKSLIDSGADVNIQNRLGLSALHYAVSPWQPQMQTAILSTLIENQATLDVRDNDQRTPLMKACRFGNFSAANQLLDAGADINLRCSTKDGYTAMHECVQCFHMLQSMQGESYARNVLNRDITNLYESLCYFFEKVRAFGGHIDIRDKHGHDVLWHALRSSRHLCLVTRYSSEVNSMEKSLLDYLTSLFYPRSLKCLAADAVADSGVMYRSGSVLPDVLAHFVDMHNPACTDRSHQQQLGLTSKSINKQPKSITVHTSTHCPGI